MEVQFWGLAIRPEFSRAVLLVLARLSCTYAGLLGNTVVLMWLAMVAPCGHLTIWQAGLGFLTE
jgi:hypothetical protein